MFYFQEINNINLYKSTVFDDKRLKHAFTTRTGGETPFPLATLSMGTAENPELAAYVKDNREKVCTILGIKPENLVIPQQRHTDNIKIVSSPNEDVSNCDGLITETPGLVLMLQFADCVPVIMYSPDRHVVAVIHAGWRGTAKSIVQKALGIFEKEFNADVQNIQAVIGPAIGKCCYPVSPEVADQLLSTIADSTKTELHSKAVTKDYHFASTRRVLPAQVGSIGNPLFANQYNLFAENVINGESLVNIDLKQLNAQQLIECGVKNIDVSDKCTSCTNTVFYSYRAEKGKTGRHAAIASLM